MKNLFPSILLLAALLISACSTMQQSRSSGPSGADNPESEPLSEEEAEALQQLLDENRSGLAEVQSGDQLEIPRAFLKEDSSQAPTNRNPYQGYRIQLVSTRDVQQADETAESFHEWVRKNIPSYEAKSYVTFKQPYYKVHVGDFQNRSRAIQYTQLLKNEYPDAWIVPDEINPGSVPADTVSFTGEKEGNL